MFEPNSALYSEDCSIVKNNIISNSVNAYGISGNAASIISYSDYFNNDLGNYYNINAGIGDISANPLFLDPMHDDYHLTEDSPCINAGDPNSPLDPDSTRADMGAFYFDMTFAPDYQVILTPYNPPITIPANGGTFDFNIQIRNNSSIDTVDVWTMMTFPGGQFYGPYLLVEDIFIPTGSSGNRDRTQSVPANAPPGDYTYDAYVGTYPVSIWDEDHFDFEKLTVSDGTDTYDDWSCWGEELDFGQTPEPLIPTAYEMFAPYPNPFNPETTIRFGLPENSRVKIFVHDILGREIAVLAINISNPATIPSNGMPPTILPESISSLSNPQNILKSAR